MLLSTGKFQAGIPTLLQWTLSVTLEENLWVELGIWRANLQRSFSLCKSQDDAIVEFVVFMSASIWWIPELGICRKFLQWRMSFLGDFQRLRTLLSGGPNFCHYDMRRGFSGSSTTQRLKWRFCAGFELRILVHYQRNFAEEILATKRGNQS